MSEKNKASSPTQQFQETIAAGRSSDTAGGDERQPSQVPQEFGRYTIERELATARGVYRYRMDDGLEGEEGCFHLCTAWLSEAHAFVGDHGAAEKWLDVLAAGAGRAGLMPEMIDPHTGAGLGNMPQAYSHLGLLSAAQRAQSVPTWTPSSR